MVNRAVCCHESSSERWHGCSSACVTCIFYNNIIDWSSIALLYYNICVGISCATHEFRPFGCVSPIRIWPEESVERAHVDRRGHDLLRIIRTWTRLYNVKTIEGYSGPIYWKNNVWQIKIFEDNDTVPDI